MKLSKLNELTSDEINYISDELHPVWQNLSVLEDRQPYKKNILLQLSSPSYYCLKHNNVIIGVFSLKEKNMTYMNVHTAKESIWLLDVFVMPDFRDNGVGAFIVDEAKRLAREKNYKYIYLQSVRKHDRYFSDKHGFVIEYWMGAIYDMPSSVIMKFEL